MRATDDLLENERARATPSALPWVLLAVAVVAGTGTSVVLLRRNAEARALARETTAKVQEEQRRTSARFVEAHDAAAALEAKVARLERENLELQVHETELTASLNAREDELARLEATAAERERKMRAEGAAAKRVKVARAKAAPAKHARRR
ncbi:MAG: hypothetical protein ACJ79L_06735 [Anaeromyxobacteraceae bacterium]